MRPQLDTAADARAGLALILAALVALSLIALTGCARDDRTRLPLPQPLLFGRSARYHPPAYGPAVAMRRPIGSLRCSAPPGRARFLAHVEVIARQRVAIVPSGIGVAPPQVRRGAFVTGGRCEYPLRTHEPTGLIEVAASHAVTLGDLFRSWDQPLSQTRLLGFSGQVTAFVGTRRRRGDPRAIPLRRHTAITLEIGRTVPPRPRYAFPRLP